MGKKKDKQKKAKEKDLNRRAAEFADEVRTPANEGRAERHDGHRDFSYTQNREVSWLRFDDRVLDEAFDETVPLFERIKFCAIFQSNMDEWFMIRIGGLSDLASLKHQPADNKSDETPAEQLDSVFELLPGMYERRESCLEGLEASLAEEGIERVTHDAYTDADLVTVSRRFESSLAPILSPMIIDPRHPFPNLRNDVMYVACSLDGPDERGMLGLVEVPASAQRIAWLPSAEGRVRYTLVEDVITSMLSQIRNHFIFNVLGTISSYCKTDPQKADEALIKFSRYLRRNMRYLETKDEVLFTTEVAQIEDYVALEQMRFDDLVEFGEDLEVTDFLLPPLTVQPLVENAIKHGLTIPGKKGTVCLSTRREPTAICISVVDDGVGFDTQKLDKADSIGIRNIRQRLHDMSDATLTIESTPGQGTRAVIRIPVKEASL